MEKKKSDILSREDNNHLALLYDGDGIIVDKSLPKYTSIKNEIGKKNAHYDIESSNDMNITPNQLNEALYENPDIKSLSDYESIKDADVHSLNVYVSNHIYHDIFSSFNVTNNLFGASSAWGDEKENKSLWRKIVDFFKSEEKHSKNVSMDVLKFFSEVKGLTKTNKDLYVDRLAGYIVALKNCDITGQVALKEQLLRDMVVNKYESVLYANNLYYVVTEDQIVKFVKKTEKGVRLTYIKNFMRALPREVMDKIKEVNTFNIFDNYAILHYDPDYSAYSETIKETKKRRDPILFGLIRGSNKLYYITDWVDEYCDLTLDQFVETLQIDKDSLKMPEQLSVY